MVRVLKPEGRVVIADLMFADQEAMQKFAERCSDAEREDLEDEYFACVDRLEVMMGFDVRYEQVDALIWIVSGDLKEKDHQKGQ